MVKKEIKKGIVREFSAGGVVFKKFKTPNSGIHIRWLIINPNGTERWQLPKGRIDKGETNIITAEREVEEEGGINVKVLQKIGQQKYFYVWEGERRLKTVTFFLMKYKSNRNEGIDKDEIGEIKFVSLEDALNILTFKNDKDILNKAAEIINSGVQFSLI